MNRDEKLTRPVGLPPTRKTVGGRKVIYPSEPGGGTWIALNDLGATHALINWHSIAERVNTDALSRGEVVRSVSACDSLDSAEATFAGLALHRINPFRLIGVYPSDRLISEWRWDLKNLKRCNHPWKTQQWISSGFDEPAARRERSATFRRARRQHSVGSLDWLRRLHRSHLPERGPFSTCMHRADAATVSYTEIAVSGRHAAMRYLACAPCQGEDKSSLKIRSVHKAKLDLV